MRVQLDVASSREKQRAAGGDASEGPCLQFLQLSFWYSRDFFLIFFLTVIFPLFFAVNRISGNSRSQFSSPASDFKWNAFL